MESGINIHLPLYLFPFSNIVIESRCGEERGEVGRREGSDGREIDNAERVEERRGEPGGEEFGELALSEVHDLLPLRFLYFLFLFLFFFVPRAGWEVED